MHHLNVSLIILAGFMGTGKTSVGKDLSKRLGFRFVDADCLIESQQQKTIAQIFEEKGEAYFRKIEKETLLGFVRSKSDFNTILAVGGGSILDPDVFQALDQNGILILLKASFEELVQRLKNDLTRPLLKQNPEEKIAELLKQRRPVYEKVGIQIETTGKKVEEIAEEIFKTIQLSYTSSLKDEPAV